MKKCTYFILFYLIPGLNYSQQLPNQKKEFGQGSLSMGVYGHSIKDSFKDEINHLDSAMRIQKISYFIDGDKIARRMIKKPVSGLTEKTDSNYITAHYTDYNYLIKYDSLLLYYYIFNGDHLEKVALYGLDSCMVEYFYRPAWSKNPIQNWKPKNERNEILINDIPCIEGEAIGFEGEVVSFYYTKRKMKVYSPLNNIFSSDFRYNVIRIRFRTDWTEFNKPIPHGGYLIFQVDHYDEQIPDASLFRLPENVPVISNIAFWQAVQENEGSVK